MTTCHGSTVTCPLQACVFELSVPSWGCCSGRLWRFWDAASLGRRRQLTECELLKVIAPTCFQSYFALRTPGCEELPLLLINLAQLLGCTVASESGAKITTPGILPQEHNTLVESD